MKYLFAILLCCVISVKGYQNVYFPRFIERYCGNPNRTAIMQCVEIHDGKQAFDLSMSCIKAIVPGMTTIEQLEEYVCGQVNQAELNSFNSCIYSGLWLHYMRGNNTMSVIEGCITMYERPLLQELIYGPQQFMNVPRK